MSDSPQQYYLHPATTVLRSSGSVWTMNLAYLLLEYLLCLFIYPSSDHLTLCTVVTRVCCGSQDPTDCWPGKAGTGSRQQQLPGGFPLYFPRPHSDYSVASHRSLVLDMRQGPYEELEVGEAGAGGGGEVRHRGHCGHVLAGGLSGLDCRVRRLRAVAEAEWSSEQCCAIPEPEPHAATSTAHQVRTGGHSIHDEQ